MTQGAQNRYFMYDSLSRLIRAKNPEQDVNTNLNLADPVTGNSQWSMKYTYQANGNLATRVDARNITTTYSYDGLNRNTGVSYNDGITPGVNRYYDGAISNGKGRLHYSLSYNSHPISGYAYSITQINGYDAMGRVSSQQQGFLNSAGTQWYYYPVSRAYNLASGVSSQTYPSNRTVSYNYDNAGRLSSFSGSLGDGVSRTYADTFSYTATGQMLKERFGTTNTAIGGGTGLYHNLHYNNRLQAVDNRLGHNPNDEWNWSRGALIMYYSNQARSVGNPFMNASDNNGNVTMAEHYVPADEAISSYSITLRDTYEYDGLNRLKQTNGVQRNTAGSWFSIYAQWYNYDQWGNRTIDNGATWGNAINNLAYTISSTNNRINGVTYDAAGSVTSDPNGVSTATYDGENRMKSAFKSGVQSYYVYDADGKRARRIISGVETWQVYGIEGELVAEYPVNGAVGTPQKEYGYRSGQTLIVGDASNVRWTVTDALSTPRIVAGKTGALSEVTRHDYLPFGEELYVNMGTGSIRTTGRGYGTGGTNDGIRKKFTSKERDDETGLDYFGARYFSSIQGRFTSADLPIVDLVPANPQSMNRYAYVRNNPCSNVDPNGRCSAPAGLKRGQVGICVEAFIATKRLPGLLGLGRGDGRGPSGNDPKLTSRIEAKLIASPNVDGKGYSIGSPQVKAAKSEVDVPLGVTVAHPRHPAGGSITISLQGTASTNTPEGKVDQNGNTSFTLTGTAQNGFQANNLPGPGGTIDFKLDFQISPTGTASVNEETSTTKEYPTYAAYSYEIDDQGNVKVTQLFLRGYPKTIFLFICNSHTDLA